MIVTTTDVIQGAVVEAYLGIVTAQVVYGTNALRDFFAGLRDFIGGATGSYEQVFEQGQREASLLQRRLLRSQNCKRKPSVLEPTLLLGLK
jgi:uncharacterized protein YbjQ (UPF0145 family)